MKPEIRSLQGGGLDGGGALLGGGERELDRIPAGAPQKYKEALLAVAGGAKPSNYQFFRHGLRH